jgi:hypothetical protein
MSIEPTIRVGDIATLIAFIVGGLGFVWSMRGDLKMLARDIKLQGTKIEKLEAVIIAQAIQGQRMDDLDRRIEEMRHGHGFIQRDVDGLYDEYGKAKFSK